MLGIQGFEARDAAPTTRNYLVQNVKNAKAQKPWNRGTGQGIVGAKKKKWLIYRFQKLKEKSGGQDSWIEL